MNVNTSKHHQSAWFKHCISGLIVLSVFAYLSYQVVLMKDDLARVDWQSVWPLMVAALLFCIATQMIQVSLWYKLVQLKNPRHFTLKRLLASFFYPIPGKYLPGKVLYAVARVELIKHSFNIERKQGSALFMFENLGMLISSALLSLPYITQQFWHFFISLTSSLQLSLYITLALLALTCTIVSLMPHLRQQMFQHRLSQKVREILNNFFILPKTAALWLGVNYNLMWISFGASGLFIVLSLTDTVFTVTNCLMMMSAFIAAWLIGFLSFLTPGGLGVREASLVLFLTPYIGIEAASLAAIISRITWTLAEFSGVLFCTLLKTTKPQLNN